MKSAAEALEDRIRERAYHLWEASGQPSGREVEFWHRACEIATDDNHSKSRAQRRKPGQTKSKPPGKRTR